MAQVIRSKSSSVRIIKRLFGNVNDNYISLEDIFRSWGRPNPENIEKHKPWLSNLMIHLKFHNLVTPVYSFGDGPRKLKGIKLTLEGKKALNRIDAYLDEAIDIKSNNISQNILSYDKIASEKDVFKIVADFQREHQEYEITFYMKLRTDKG